MNKKLDKKYEQIVFILLMSIVMMSIMSFIMTLINKGLGTDFLINWFKSFSVGVMCGVPIAYLVMPKIKNFVSKFF